MSSNRVHPIVFSALAVGLFACGEGGPSSLVGTGELTPMAAVGQKLFEDTALSASGRQSCGTCHDAAHGFADDQMVPLGGPGLDLQGLRNTPSIAYASFAPPFAFDAEGAPSGGFFRDGRAATLADQARAPFLNGFEMANADASELLERLRGRPYRAELESVFGASVLGDPDAMMEAVGRAIAEFEKQSPALHAFSSKFDAFQKGEAALTEKELRGFALFNDPTRGNCAACHPSSSADGVVPALFTDFSYDNLGVPRNRALAANDDVAPPGYVPQNGEDGVHRYYDLGLCGPTRADLTGNVAPLCGAFKVPTLRNVALTAPYFHNGVFGTLREAVGFYVRRNTHPSEWFPTAPDGTVAEFDDLPAPFGGHFAVIAGEPGSDVGYAGNVNTGEVPYDRQIGQAPRLNQEEIDALVSFLCTLTDGFDPAHPGAYPWPDQCEAVEPRPSTQL